MESQIQVLTVETLDLAYEYALHKMQTNVSDENERTFALWKASWRRESLEHYVKIGWSLGLWKNTSPGETAKGKFVGIALVQPILFFRTQMQTLWIEYVSAESNDSTRVLLDTIHRMARDNHVQRIVIAKGELQDSMIRDFKGIPIDDQFYELRTTKG